MLEDARANGVEEISAEVTNEADLNTEKAPSKGKKKQDMGFLSDIEAFDPKKVKFANPRSRWRRAFE